MKHHGDLVQLSPKYLLLEIFGQFRTQFTKEEMDKMQLNSQSKTLQSIIEGDGGIEGWASRLRKKTREGLFATQKKFIQKNASIPNETALVISKEKFAKQKRGKKKLKQRDAQGTSSGKTTPQKQKRRRHRDYEGKSEDAPPPGHADSDRNADGISKRRKKTPPDKKTKKKKPSYDGKVGKTLMFAFVQDDLTESQREKAAKLLTDRRKAGRDHAMPAAKKDT